MVRMTLEHDNHDMPGRIENKPHQHAFTIVGDETIYGVHMTQYHCEIHKYQLILELSLPKAVLAELRKMRAAYPSDFFVLCNQKTLPELPPGKPDPLQMSIPELASGIRPTFKADIFQGIRPITEDPGEHFFPWSHDRCRPAIKGFDVEIKRVVSFRPFAHHYEVPDFATYLLWGKGKEAHMTNLQTAHMVSGKFEREAFGVDFDHVMSLAEPTDRWLEDALLQSGIVVTAPALRLKDPVTGAPAIPCESPFDHGDKIELLYRGTGKPQSVTAGYSYLYCTQVCNSPTLLPCPPTPTANISEMPKKYWT